MTKRKFVNGDKVQSVSMGNVYGAQGQVVQTLRHIPGTARRYRVRLDCGALYTFKESWLERKDNAAG